MPQDKNIDEEEYAAEEKDLAGTTAGAGRRFKDFDCPDCSANNPYDEGFGDGDEVRCFYCGLEFRVEVSEEGRARFKEI